MPIPSGSVELVEASEGDVRKHLDVLGRRKGLQ